MSSIAAHLVWYGRPFSSGLHSLAAAERLGALAWVQKWTGKVGSRKAEQAKQDSRIELATDISTDEENNELKSVAMPMLEA